MRFFICTDCGCLMNEIEATTFVPEIHYELDNHPVEMISELHCIYCNADEDWLEEAEICDECGEWFPTDELIDGLCRVCWEKVNNVNA